jgi:GxxExxY protein
MMTDVEQLATHAIDCGLEVHRELGPGLLESVYEVVLEASLLERGLTVERQKTIDIVYKGRLLRDGFRADLLVGGALIVEVKSVERLALIHGKQLLTYLRLARHPLGLLMNFGAPTFREGLKRIVNGHRETASSPLLVNRVVQ